MSFDKEVEHIPEPASHGLGLDDSEVKYKLFQKRKWQLTIGTFLLVLILANTVIWNQAPIYQSQSTLSLSYSSEDQQRLTEFSHQEIMLHQQRLTSSRVLNLVSKELEQFHNLVINAQTLSQALSSEVNLSSYSISLKAKGNDKKVLEVMLDSLSKVYLQLVESEIQANNNNELLVAEQKFQFLELKITDQERKLQLFANQNNIISSKRDERLILNQTIRLTRDVESALSDQTKAQASIDKFVESINAGQTVIQSNDRRQINATKYSLKKINASLSELSKEYTQVYLELDPDIVDQQQKAQQLQTLLEEQIQTSQTDYLFGLERELLAAGGRVQQANILLIEQDELEKISSQNLKQYEGLSNELKALQTQAKRLKNQQVALEVSNPYKAKISLFEPAFTPNFAIGPNYQFNSLISLMVAAAIAILALLMFSFLFKHKT